MNAATTSFESFCKAVRHVAGDDKLERAKIRTCVMLQFDPREFPGHIVKADGRIEPPLSAEENDLLIQMVAEWFVLDSGQEERLLKIQLEIKHLRRSGPGW
jgi:hypothetical protein